jgi:hypothetical protein
MPERSSLNQVVQVGVETTPGTSVAANKRLTALSIEPSISAEIDTFRPAGQKYQSLTALGKEWVEADISGRATYTELIYPLSSVINTATMGTNPSTNTRLWQFNSSSTADDVPKTFTVEAGSGVRAHKFTYGLVNEFGMSFSRDAVELSGSMIGRAITDNIVLTAAPTSVALIPILPTEVSIYLDTTQAGIGTTKLTRALSAEFNIGSRFGPVWVLDHLQPGFVATVETEPDLTLDLTVEADAQGMGLLTQLRDGATRWVRIRAIGGIAELAINYQFTLDMAVKVADTGGFSDEDGVYAIEWNFVGVHDNTWGKAFTIEIINMLTAL